MNYTHFVCRTTGGNIENSFIRLPCVELQYTDLKKLALHNFTDRHLLINVDNADINVLPNEMLTEFHLE
jgi:hypothetical protein